MVENTFDLNFCHSWYVIFFGQSLETSPLTSCPTCTHSVMCKNVPQQLLSDFGFPLSSSGWPGVWEERGDSCSCWSPSSFSRLSWTHSSYRHTPWVTISYLALNQPQSVLLVHPVISSYLGGLYIDEKWLIAWRSSMESLGLMVLEASTTALEPKESFPSLSF